MCGRAAAAGTARQGNGHRVRNPGSSPCASAVRATSRSVSAARKPRRCPALRGLVMGARGRGRCPGRSKGLRCSTGRRGAGKSRKLGPPPRRRSGCGLRGRSSARAGSRGRRVPRGPLADVRGENCVVARVAAQPATRCCTTTSRPRRRPQGEGQTDGNLGAARPPCRCMRQIDLGHRPPRLAQHPLCRGSSRAPTLDGEEPTKSACAQ